MTAPAPQARPAAGGLRAAVLGSLLITGTAQELTPRQAELVVALALAGPGGLSGDSLRGMLGAGPDRPAPPAGLRQLASRTRRRLGPAPAGGPRIACRGGTYALDPAPALDWDEFRALAARGNAAGDRGPLRAALDLVRGKPLTGLYWHWVDTVLIETMRDAIAGAAAQLAGLELAAGDPAAARRAARTGLAVRVEAEPLWRALMRAEDAEGSTAGVHAAYRSCLAAVSAVAPGAAPHRDTAALYRDLARRPPGGPGPQPGQHGSRDAA